MNGAALRRAVIAILMVVSGVGCTVIARPTALNARPADERDPVFDIVLGRFAGMYIDRAAIEPPMMLEGGVSELAATVPGLSYTTDTDSFTLELAGRRVRLSKKVSDIGELSTALDAVSAWVQDADQSRSPLILKAAAMHGAVRAVDRWGSVLQGRRRDALMSRFRGSMAGVGCRLGRRGERAGRNPSEG